MYNALIARRLTPLRPISRRMHAFEGVDEIRYQRSKDGIKCRAAGDQYVVEVAPRVLTQNGADRGLEAPPDTIALDGTAKPLADREAVAGLFQGVRQEA